MINLHSGPDLIGSGVRNVGGSPTRQDRHRARPGKEHHMNGHEAEHHNAEHHNAEHHNAEHHNAEHHNAEHHNAEHHNFDYDPGYPQTYEGDFDNAYDRFTAGDIADLLHHLAEMRCNTPAGRPHP